jgi:diketogulonate reductase-like aldo/keto reductase
MVVQAVISTISLGYRHIDTASIYKNERGVCWPSHQGK